MKLLLSVDFQFMFQLDPLHWCCFVLPDNGPCKYVVSHNISIWLFKGFRGETKNSRVVAEMTLYCQYDQQSCSWRLFAPICHTWFAGPDVELFPFRCCLFLHHVAAGSQSHGGVSKSAALEHVWHITILLVLYHLKIRKGNNWKTWSINIASPHIKNISHKNKYFFSAFATQFLLNVIK